MIALSITIAIAAVIVSLVAFRQVAVLTARMVAIEQTRLPAPDVQPALEAPKTLEGLRVGLAITQDHAHPVLANLLKEQLLKQDVADVTILPVGTTVDDWRSAATADILIAGALTCNGYAEVYYQAEFTCYSQSDTICTLIERPPGGDRPENLALELVTKLNDTLAKVTKRDERRRAIGELRGN